MKCIKLFSVLAFAVTLSANAHNDKKECKNCGVAKPSAMHQHAATWKEEEPVQSDYQFYLYRNQGGFVEAPGYLGSAIGVVPGVVVGAVVGVPLLPFNDYENTVTSTTLMFGKGGSMILGLPFYGLKKIFWDFPKSAFD